jgi:hypothetical protein
MSAAFDPLATPHGLSDEGGHPADRGAATIMSIPQRVHLTTCDYLARRLQAVFNDLGLFSHIPSDWLQPGPDGLSFRPLSVREADKLTLAVEDLAQGYRPQRPSVSPDQLPLF